VIVCACLRWEAAFVTVIYLVQHGEKVPVPGDPGLTALGQNQAALTACWFARIGLAALYSSPLRRARETADPLARAVGLAVRVDRRLRERVNWQAGQPLGQFLADWDRSTRDRDLVPDNGESSRLAGERMRGFVASLAGGPGPVAAVCHGGVTLDLLRTLAGDAALPPRLLRDGLPACAITTLDDLGVVAIASTAHLARATS